MVEYTVISIYAENQRSYFLALIRAKVSLRNPGANGEPSGVLNDSLANTLTSNGVSLTINDEHQLISFFFNLKCVPIINRGTR